MIITPIENGLENGYFIETGYHARYKDLSADCETRIEAMNAVISQVFMEHYLD